MSTATHASTITPLGPARWLTNAAPTAVPDQSGSPTGAPSPRPRGGPEALARSYPDPDDGDDAPASTVALITGAGRGIGRLLATSLAAQGLAVGVLSRSPEELAGIVRLVRSAGGTAAAVTADVTDPDAVSAAVTELTTRLGPIDLLVNNAGVIGPIGPMWQLDAGQWWSAFDVNVRGALLCIQAVLPTMVERQRGRVINLTSHAGLHRWPLVSGYSVSKAAVAKLTENLAHEASRYGISVFSVHPGLLPIGMGEHVLSTEAKTPYEAAVRNWTANELHAGRGADPSQAVDLVLRLAAGDGDPLSGRHLSVHDDLDELLAHVPQIRQRDLYILRPERLPASGSAVTALDRDSAPVPSATSLAGGPALVGATSSTVGKGRPAHHAGSRVYAGRAYYWGRSTDVWQQALERRRLLRSTERAEMAEAA